MTWSLCVKLIAFELAAKVLEARGKSRSTTFVQRVKRNFQSAHNGVFPPLAIFAGQLKRNQLYVKNFCYCQTFYLGLRVYVKNFCILFVCMSRNKNNSKTFREAYGPHIHSKTIQNLKRCCVI